MCTDNALMEAVAENLWLLSHPLPLLGEYLGRNVTIIRLRSGDLVIHSTAPFSPDDVAAISALGRPAFLVEATTLHDTFVNEGRQAFPDVPYYAPEGFSKTVGFPTESLAQPPGAWAGELGVLALAGKSRAPEYAFHHGPSRTLIVADLTFNVTDDAPLGTRLFATVATHGGTTREVKVPRVEKFTVTDPDAFRRATETMLAWDFDRVIVGHGETIETDGKRRLREALRTAGL